jgi:RecA/RadA recombinase
MANISANIARYIKSEADLNQQLTRELLPTGVSAFDMLSGGLPRGALTEIYGPPSSGKTSLLHTFISTATLSGEFCALLTPQIRLIHTHPLTEI